MTTAFILIPIHNRIDVTKKGLNDLYEALNKYWDNGNSNSVDFKIVIIDDGSKDGSYEYISRNYKDIILLKGNGNLWWSGAINKGVDYVKNHYSSYYLLLWNDDILPSSNYFIEVAKILDGLDAKNTIYGSLIFDIHSGQLWSGGGKFNNITGRKYMIKKFSDNNEKYSQVGWLTGMGTLIPKNVIDKIGLWDNINFPQYHGDIDFTLRAKKAGFLIVVSKKLKIFNRTEHSSLLGNNLKEAIKLLSDIRNRYNIKKNILFYKRHTKTPFWILIMIKNYIIFFVKILIK